MITAILLGLLALPFLIFLRRRFRRRSGIREIVYNTTPIAGRIKKPRKGERL